MRSGKVRRAKLYYLRDRKGKSARISEKIKKTIGIDVSEKIIENEIPSPIESNKTKTTIDLKNKDTEKEKLKKD